MMGMLLNLCTVRSTKTYIKRSLKGFITIINLKVCKPFIFYFFPYLAKVLFIK